MRSKTVGQPSDGKVNDALKQHTGSVSRSVEGTTQDHKYNYGTWTADRARPTDREADREDARLDN